MMFIRTILVQGKIGGGDRSVFGKVRVGEFLTGEIRTRSETLRGGSAAQAFHQGSLSVECSKIR